MTTEKKIGGARPGAGRKKGTQNAKTKALLAAVDRSGLTPLDYMLQVMRDPKADSKRRDWAAGAAASYVHPKLASVEHSGSGKDGAILLQMMPSDADL